MGRIGITTDCVCDLPAEFLRAHGVDVMYFYIITDAGRFRDGYAITSANILEYLEEGGAKAETHAPSSEEYKGFFEKRLAQYDELIHISISGQIGVSYQNASGALALMGENSKRVRVIDSEHLSTGMGHMVMKAVEMRDAGRPAAEIVEAVERMRSKVSTTFITQNADYLHRNGRVGKGITKLTELFMIHPVLVLKKGRITVKAVRAGNYEKAVLRYVRGELKRGGRINKNRLFITHAGCPIKMISQIREEVEKRCGFDGVIVTKASATVSSNCGPQTLGVIFVYD